MSLMKKSKHFFETILVDFLARLDPKSCLNRIAESIYCMLDDLMPLKAHMTDLDYHIKSIAKILKSRKNEVWGILEGNQASKAVQVRLGEARIGSTGPKSKKSLTIRKGPKSPKNGVSEVPGRPTGASYLDYFAGRVKTAENLMNEHKIVFHEIKSESKQNGAKNDGKGSKVGIQVPYGGSEPEKLAGKPPKRDFGFRKNLDFFTQKKIKKGALWISKKDKKAALELFGSVGAEDLRKARFSNFGPSEKNQTKNAQNPQNRQKKHSRSSLQGPREGGKAKKPPQSFKMRYSSSTASYNFKKNSAPKSYTQPYMSAYSARSQYEKRLQSFKGSQKTKKSKKSKKGKNSKSGYFSPHKAPKQVKYDPRERGWSQNDRGGLAIDLKSEKFEKEENDFSDAPLNSERVRKPSTVNKGPTYHQRMLDRCYFGSFLTKDSNFETESRGFKTERNTARKQREHRLSTIYSIRGEKTDKKAKKRMTKKYGKSVVYLKKNSSVRKRGLQMTSKHAKTHQKALNPKNSNIQKKYEKFKKTQKNKQKRPTKHTNEPKTLSKEPALTERSRKGQNSNYFTFMKNNYSTVSGHLSSRDRQPNRSIYQARGSLGLYKRRSGKQGSKKGDFRDLKSGGKCEAGGLGFGVSRQQSRRLVEHSSRDRLSFLKKIKDSVQKTKLAFFEQKE